MRPISILIRWGFFVASNRLAIHIVGSDSIAVCFESLIGLSQQSPNEQGNLLIYLVVC